MSVFDIIIIRFNRHEKVQEFVDLFDKDLYFIKGYFYLQTPATQNRSSFSL